MPLSNDQKQQIEDVIKSSLRNKFLNYQPESKGMPFHYRLLGRDRMALFSFIHSLNTTFGTSIFEPVAEVLATLKFPNVEKQYVVGSKISTNAQTVIQNIIDELTSGKLPDKLNEIERLRDVCQSGKMASTKPPKVDIAVKHDNGSIHLFDLKTAKPNKSNFKDFKRTILEWVAIFLAKDPDAQVQSYIAIPYNPYAPKPYARWTMAGMLDLPQELKVAEEFWDFLNGGEEVYEDLLSCFETVGIALKSEIDHHFSKFQ